MALGGADGRRLKVEGGLFGLGGAACGLAALGGALAGAVAVLDAVRLQLGGGVLAGFVEAVFGQAGGDFVVDDAIRVVGAEALAVGGVEVPGLVDEGGFDVGEFGDPLADEGAVGVVVETLFHRRIDADGVDAGLAGLHLALRPMDAWFVIREQAGEGGARGLPGQPEIVGGEGHEHGAHAEIDPAMGDEIAHRGVEEGVAGLAGDPALEGGWVGWMGAEISQSRDEGLGFDGGLCFEFLNEMAVPVQAGDEGAHGADPGLVG